VSERRHYGRAAGGHVDLPLVTWFLAEGPVGKRLGSSDATNPPSEWSRSIVVFLATLEH
jgi:hypothetical protein